MLKGWNRVYTEVSSFQGVGIEEFHCIQRCPHFRRLEFHCIQRCPHFRRLEFHCIQRCPHFRVLEWRGSTVYRGVLISRGWFHRFGIEGFCCDT